MTYGDQNMYSCCRDCPSCKRSVPGKNFLGRDECSKCIYERKLFLSDAKYDLTGKFCKVCKEKIETSRHKYCSKECALKAEGEQNKKVWFRNIKGEKRSFKYKFGKGANSGKSEQI